MKKRIALVFIFWIGLYGSNVFSAVDQSKTCQHEHVCVERVYELHGIPTIDLYLDGYLMKLTVGSAVQGVYVDVVDVKNKRVVFIINGKQFEFFQYGVK